MQPLLCVDSSKSELSSVDDGERGESCGRDEEVDEEDVDYGNGDYGDIDDSNKDDCDKDFDDEHDGDKDDVDDKGDGDKDEGDEHDGDRFGTKRGEKSAVLPILSPSCLVTDPLKYYGLICKKKTKNYF